MKGARFPSRMPTDYILKQIAFPPPAAALRPITALDGTVRQPRISGRDQWRIHKACRMAGLDAVEVVGLQPEVANTVKYTMPKGYNREIEKYTREKKIETNMADMPKRVETWKEERRKTKAAAKPLLPF
ncbi:hypothetical protein DFS34DRAFT_610210 [Phlyctochytrium arcticum]|nr:hypothetical protein DFS34DRAFT_610210 [Phlyctochytrium arcticum]